MNKLETAREILMAVVVFALVVVFYALFSNIIASVFATAALVTYTLSHLNDQLIGKVDEFLRIFIE